MSNTSTVAVELARGFFKRHAPNNRFNKTGAKKRAAC